MDMAFLGAVSDGSPTQWRISVQVGDKLLPFNMDTGAQVTAISEQTFKGVSPSKVLCGLASVDLPCHTRD